MLSKLIGEDGQGWCYYFKNEHVGQWALFSEDFLTKLMQHPKFQNIEHKDLKEKPNALD